MSVDLTSTVYAILAVGAGWLLVTILKWFRSRLVLLKQMPLAPGETFLFGHGWLVLHPRVHVFLKELADKLGPYYYIRILAYHVSSFPFSISRKLTPHQ